MSVGHFRVPVLHVYFLSHMIKYIDSVFSLIVSVKQFQLLFCYYQLL